MRLCFTNGEHADVLVDNGAASIGSAEANSVVLDGEDIAARHARISVDARGAVLEVLDAGARTHVNARPVREKALLRMGDVLSFGAVTMLLKPDRDDIIETSLPDMAGACGRDPALSSRTVMRGVSGAHFGKTVAIERRLVIGRDADCDLRLDDASLAPHHAVLEHDIEAIHLRSLESSSGTSVNGVPVKDAVLHSGDQLAFASERFVLEAPGMPLRGQIDTPTYAPSITQAFRAIDIDVQQPPSGAGRNSIWWLIGAAALIALVLTALLLWGVQARA